MEKYIEHLPYFLVFVFLGIGVNFMFSTPNESITKKRLLREVFGAIWVSIIMFAIIEEFFMIGALFTYAICSIAGFANSKIIEFLKEDLWVFLIKEFKKVVTRFFDRFKFSRKSDYKEEIKDKAIEYLEERRKK